MRDEERQRLLYDAVLGELSDEEQARLYDELLTNPELQREHEELQQMWSQLGEALDVPGIERAPLQRLQRPERRTRWLAWGAGIAATLLAFSVGYTWGGRATDQRYAEDLVLPVNMPGSSAQFAILLYAGGGPPSDAPPSPAAQEFIARVVEEHRVWGEQLQAENRHILGEKLATTPGVDLVSVQGEVQRHDETADLGGRRLGGLYVVTAATLEEATAIAEGCPLLNYGGVVRVRAIEPTPNKGEGE